MKKQLLNRYEQEQVICEMWDKVNEIPDDDENRHEAVQAALAKQQEIYKQLDMQDKMLQSAWSACYHINPENPLLIMLQISAGIDTVPELLSASLADVTNPH